MKKGPIFFAKPLIITEKAARHCRTGNKKLSLESDAARAPTPLAFPIPNHSPPDAKADSLDAGIPTPKAGNDFQGWLDAEALPPAPMRWSFSTQTTSLLSNPMNKTTYHKIQLHQSESRLISVP
jgi:hypothetical protein